MLGRRNSCPRQGGGANKSGIAGSAHYCTGVFLLPKSLCQQLNQLMNRYWWGAQNKDRFTSWMSWGRLGRSKQRGGLGFRDVGAINLALLAKQGWRVMQNPQSLVTTVLKEKYFPNGSSLSASLGRKPSYAWGAL